MTTPRPLFVLSVFLFLFHSITAVDFSPGPTAETPTNCTDFIRTSCNSTLYPELCYTSLARYSSSVQQDPAQLARVAIGVTLSKVKHMAVYVSNISREADYGADPRAAAALHDCFSNFGDAVEEIYGSLKQMRHLGGSPGAPAAAASRERFRFLMSNVQTWMSAALTDEDTCADGFDDVPDGPVKTDVIDRVAYVKKLTSNALALVNTCAQKGTN